MVKKDWNWENPENSATDVTEIALRGQRGILSPVILQRLLKQNKSWSSLSALTARITINESDLRNEQILLEQFQKSQPDSRAKIQTSVIISHILMPPTLEKHRGWGSHGLREFGSCGTHLRGPREVHRVVLCLKQTNQYKKSTARGNEATSMKTLFHQAAMRECMFYMTGAVCWCCHSRKHRGNPVAGRIMSDFGWDS